MNTTTLIEDWEKEFDKDFMPTPSTDPYISRIEPHVTSLMTDVKTFIRSLLQEERQKGRDEIIEYVKRAKSAVPVEDNGMSRFGIQLCNEILLESARNSLEG